MRGFATSSQVGIALLKAGLYPFALDTDMFQIVWKGENYTVYTDRLPELYIEKKVPLYCFEYKNDISIINYAMDRVNARRSPVVVYSGASPDMICFRICIMTDYAEDFLDHLDSYYIKIENAVDAFGQACEVAIRYLEEEMMSDCVEELTNPDPDSPWLKNKRNS